MKHIYDRLVKAEWVEKVNGTPGPQPELVQQKALTWVKGKSPFIDGEFKILMFSRCYRELLKSGPISSEEINKIVEMGREFAIQKGWENFTE
jgi:hypothetical protein